MIIVQILEVLAGLAMVASIMSDVFLTVVVPRRAPRLGRLLRISRYVVGTLWTPWRTLGLRLSDSDRREGFLGSFGALAVILLLVDWVAGLVVGYGLLLDALREQIRPVPESLGASLYFAGTSLLTLGFGDYQAVS